MIDNIKLINQFKIKLNKHGFRGQFNIDEANRRINATDNSIYELMPEAVVQPLNEADLLIMLKVANQQEFHSLNFCPRGGGTGTNGQSLSTDIVIDFSRFMTGVLEFDPINKTITVESGMVLSKLNQLLVEHDLFFAPNISTANRATIGGMIATDAAGKGSLIYGKTSDHLLGIRLILADGEIIDTINSRVHQSSRHQFLTQQLRQYLAPLQNEIAARFPPLKRPLSGYNLQKAYDPQTDINLNYLIAGSEGSLGLVTAAKLKLLPIPKFKALVVVHYQDFISALADAEFLGQFKPLAIEVIDEKVQRSAQSLPNWPVLAKLLKAEDRNYISNFVELIANSQIELDTNLTELTNALDQHMNNYVRILDPKQIQQLWEIRTLAVGLAGKIEGVAKPIAFIEDAIVPTYNLAKFVTELKAELDSRQINYAMYGHVDVGCIHVRPALDMQNHSERLLIRPLTEQVIELVSKYNGVLWGEHGKGFRGEFVPQVFGPVLYPVLCQIKALFDPHNRLNPSKLTAPDPNTQLKRIDQVVMRGELDQVISSQDQQQFSAAILCNGNAACFNQQASNIMCPSYKITQERIHSPKGRAMLIKQWLREKAKANEQPKRAAQDAYSALAGCLGCKGCAGKCPTQVSIPDLRTKFLYEYHKTYKRRKLREVILGYSENLLLVAAKLPRLWNFVQRFNLARLLGMSDLPLINTQLNLTKIFAATKVPIYSSVNQAAQLPNNAVVIFVDVFTGLINPEVLLATIEVLSKLDLVPYIMYPRVSGKALIVGGFIEQFKHLTNKLAQLINPLARRNIPVIGLENTIVQMFRDELPKFATPLVAQIFTLAEFLDRYHLQLAQYSAEKSNSQHYWLFPHCTEQALLTQEGSNWQQIFGALKVHLEVKNLGCCGMAGSYGYIKQNRDNSFGLYAMNWQKDLENLVDAQVLVSGFSCRSQISRINRSESRHPIMALRDLIYKYKEIL